MTTDRPTDQKCEARITGSAGDKPAGSPCGNPAGYKTDHLGFGRCHLHGGATPNGVKAAEKEAAAWRARLEAEIDPSLNTVVGLRDDTTVEPRTRLAASKDLLDRAGVKVAEGEVAPTVNIVVNWPERM